MPVQDTALIILLDSSLLSLLDLHYIMHWAVFITSAGFYIAANKRKRPLGLDKYRKLIWLEYVIIKISFIMCNCYYLTVVLLNLLKNVQKLEQGILVYNKI